MKLLIINISVNNKVRDLKFYYVVTASMTAMTVNSLRDCWVLKKSYNLIHLILLQMSSNLIYGLRMVGYTYLPNFNTI